MASHSDKLDALTRDSLPDSAFGIPRLREYPMPDAAHVRAAEAYFRHAPQDKKGELARRIVAKGKQFGVDVKSPTVLEWAKK